jgi:hypothetical protein
MSLTKLSLAGKILIILGQGEFGWLREKRFFTVYVPGTIIFKLSFEASGENYVVFIEILIFASDF